MSAALSAPETTTIFSVSELVRTCFAIEFIYCSLIFPIARLFVNAGEYTVVLAREIGKVSSNSLRTLIHFLFVQSILIITIEFLRDTVRDWLTIESLRDAVRDRLLLFKRVMSL